MGLESQLCYLQHVWPWTGLSELQFHLQTGENNRVDLLELGGELSRTMCVECAVQPLGGSGGCVVAAAIVVIILTADSCTWGFSPTLPSEGVSPVGPCSPDPGQLFLVSALTPSSAEGLSSELPTHCPGWVTQGPAPHPPKRGHHGLHRHRLQPCRWGAREAPGPCGPRPPPASLGAGSTIRLLAGRDMARGNHS